MGELIMGTSQELWNRLIKDAKDKAQEPLDEFLTRYLISVIAKHMTDEDFYKEALALRLLSTYNTENKRLNSLRIVGEESLLLLGLFPANIERRGLPQSYFVRLGRTAFLELSNYTKGSTSHMYTEIIFGFIQMVKVLRALGTEKGEVILTPLSSKPPLLMIKGENKKILF